MPLRCLSTLFSFVRSLYLAMKYAPPPGPPPSYKPPPNVDNRPDLLPSTAVPLPFPILASRGWVSLPMAAYPTMRDAYASLFTQASAFFSLPPDSPHKTLYAAPDGIQASENGFFAIPNEKHIITLRCASRCPEPLREAAGIVWEETRLVMRSIIRGIEETLGLEAGAFEEVSEPGSWDEDPGTTLLRMFRYDRPEAGEPKKTVAEPHKDLGLITIVVGHSPGLDALDPSTPPSGEWVSVEETGSEPSLTATLLTGQALLYLSQGRYRSGVHRVTVAPGEKNDPYRFSFVFALRPSKNAKLWTKRFESPQIGPFSPVPFSAAAFPFCSMDGVPGGALLTLISKRHWNVNIAKDLREEQKKKYIETQVPTNEAKTQSQAEGKPE